MVMLTLANIIFESSFCHTAKKSSECRRDDPEGSSLRAATEIEQVYFTVIFTVLVMVVFRHLLATLGTVTFTFRV